MNETVVDWCCPPSVSSSKGDNPTGGNEALRSSCLTIGEILADSKRNQACYQIRGQSSDIDGQLFCCPAKIVNADLTRARNQEKHAENMQKMINAFRNQLLG